MWNVIISLVPLIIGGALFPYWVITTLLLLHNDRGVVKASAFAAGAIFIRLLEGILFGYVFVSAAESDGGTGPPPIESTLLLVVGMLLLATAVTNGLRSILSTPTIESLAPHSAKIRQLPPT